MGWWKNIFSSQTQDWIYAALEHTKVPESSIPKPVLTDESYVRIYLKSMRVVNVRRGLTKFYGAVHSFASFLHASGKSTEFSRLIVPSQLKNVDAKNIDRVITVNKPLAGWTPYRGGDVELEVGLFSIKAVDMADSFLDLLEQIGGLAAVPYISTAIPFIPLMKQGFDLLTGTGDTSILEIGLSKNYTSLNTGYFIVMRANQGSISVDDLYVNDTDFKLLYGDGQQVKEYPYMVFQIEASTKRDDWYKIPELKETYSILQSDVRQGHYNDARESLNVFKRTALTCNDLLFKDAKKLVSDVENKVKEIMSTTQVSVSEYPKEMPDLSKISLFD